jgi:uncharacterized membrane protein YdbT with pleckstrin-like domain
MSYVDKTLLPGEQVAFRTQLHWILYVPAAVIIALGLASFASPHTAGLGVYILLAGLATALIAYVRRSASEFAVTNKRVIVKVGFVRRRTIEMLLRQVEALEVQQDILGRILGYGTIVIVGTGGTREPFEKIGAPLEFRRAAQAAST